MTSGLALIAATARSATGSSPSAAALTTDNALARLSPGINLGNTLEAIPTETSWGNPPPTKEFMLGKERAGFRSIRIPVAWSQYANAENKISGKWIAHVKEVVRMATKAGLYVLINIHWDGGWIQPTETRKDAVNTKLKMFWTQIAETFKGFDDHVLFAGTNEIGVPGDYGPPKIENAAIQNGFNQTFVTTVRATGGQNCHRFLVVQAYNTDIDNAVKFNVRLPLDTTRGRLMMEVHYYSPYDFTLNEKSNIWQWGKSATDSSATESWADEEYTDKQFQKVRETFVARGVPVILGEYACGMKKRFPGMDSYRKLWDAYVTRSAFSHGVIPMYWDTGGLIDRITGQPKDPIVIHLIVGACKRT